jgi:hypothetical protein
MTVPLDTPVGVVVTSDAADEIDVHGYDLKAEIPPGVLRWNWTTPSYRSCR